MKRVLLNNTINMVERMNRKYSTYGNSLFFDSEQFNWVKQVENYYPKIQQEFKLMLDAQKYMPSMSKLSGGKNILTKKDNWRVCTLIRYGERVINDAYSFSNTYKALDKIPYIKTEFFSILPPAIAIDPHRGPYNKMLRYHLGISMPEGDCGIRVGNEMRKWKTGCGLIFDDSHEHEAWNKTRETQVVLFIDFMRPLAQPIRLINSIIYKYITNNQFTKQFINNAKSVTNNY